MPRILVLSIAGNEVRVKGLRLFPGPDVAEWRATVVQAQQELAGTSSGIGLFGSPGWVLGGAMILGAIESVMSSSKAKEALRTLGRANSALRTLRENGIIFDIDELRNVDEPNPSAWVGDASGDKIIDLSKIAMLDRRSFIESHGKTKSDVSGGFLRITVDVVYVGLGEDFLSFQLEDDNILNVRWSSVNSYSIES